MPKSLIVSPITKDDILANACVNIQSTSKKSITITEYQLRKLLTKAKESKQRAVVVISFERKNMEPIQLIGEVR